MRQWKTLAYCEERVEFDDLLTVCVCWFLALHYCNSQVEHYPTLCEGEGGGGEAEKGGRERDVFLGSKVTVFSYHCDTLINNDVTDDGLG